MIGTFHLFSPCHCEKLLTVGRVASWAAGCCAISGASQAQTTCTITSCVGQCSRPGSSAKRSNPGTTSPCQLTCTSGAATTRSFGSCDAFAQRRKHMAGGVLEFIAGHNRGDEAFGFDGSLAANRRTHALSANLCITFHAVAACASVERRIPKGVTACLRPASPKRRIASKRLGAPCIQRLGSLRLECHTDRTTSSSSRTR